MSIVQSAILGFRQSAFKASCLVGLYQSVCVLFHLFDFKSTRFCFTPLGLFVSWHILRCTEQNRDRNDNSSGKRDNNPNLNHVPLVVFPSSSDTYARFRLIFFLSFFFWGGGGGGGNGYSVFRPEKRRDYKNLCCLLEILSTVE